MIWYMICCLFHRSWEILRFSDARCVVTWQCKKCGLVVPIKYPKYEYNRIYIESLVDHDAEAIRKKLKE